MGRSSPGLTQMVTIGHKAKILNPSKGQVERSGGLTEMRVTRVGRGRRVHLHKKKGGAGELKTMLCTQAGIQRHTQASIHVHTHTGKYTHTSMPHTHSQACIHTHTEASMHPQARMYTQASMHTYTHTQASMHAHTQASMNTHAHSPCYPHCQNLRVKNQERVAEDYYSEISG